ncbi:tetratricopeptide repeat protein [Rosettibacter firmus]|uniref:tetratricopeptide repeat protein n=1 Tax=Rosettibacter firmus TaxID=3111522 RepID=UPI00336BD5BF
MKLRIIYTLLLISTSISFAQSYRNLINEGVELYKNKKFADAEVNFKKGLEKKSDLFEGHFNLGDAYYKQGRYDEAIQAYKNALSFTKDKINKSKVYHNIGNSFLKSQRYKESIEAYKNALKLNPDDLDTKYNLSYALKYLNQNQNQQKQNKDQNKQDKNNQNQQNQNNQDKQDRSKENQKQNQQQQQKNQISKEEAERILEALKNNEQDLQKKLRKIKGRASAVDKDW